MHFCALLLLRYCYCVTVGRCSVITEKEAQIFGFKPDTKCEHTNLNNNLREKWNKGRIIEQYEIGKSPNYSRGAAVGLCILG